MRFSTLFVRSSLLLEASVTVERHCVGMHSYTGLQQTGLKKVFLSILSDDFPLAIG
jgi:hypothetical protein